jgi:hypothetical protein
LQRAIVFSWRRSPAAHRPDSSMNTGRGLDGRSYRPGVQGPDGPTARSVRTTPSTDLDGNV